MTDYIQRRLGGLNNLYKDLNAISVIALLPIIVFLILSIYLALNGKSHRLLSTAPLLVPVIGYWYWRFKVLRVSCRDYRKRRDVEEYEKALKLDSFRTPLLASTVVSTQFYLLIGNYGPVLYASLFIGYFSVLMFLIGLEVLYYWFGKRQDLKRLKS